MSSFLKSSLQLAAILPLLFVKASADDAPVRGRDPWAFRLTLENKTRMLVAALRPDLWVAYNPANGTLHKVWNGGIQFHGKVYDFGQQNSVTLGDTYHLQKRATLFSAENENTIPSDWSAMGVSTGAVWSFSQSGGSMFESPAVDLRLHDHVVLAYHTPGANNRLLVDVSNNNGATWTAQQWMSVDGAVADGHQKLVEVTGARVKFRFRPNTSGNTATLADVTLIGDYRAWTLKVNGDPVPVSVDWRGYRLVEKTEGIVIRYDVVLPGGERIGIEESPEALPGMKLQRNFEVTDLPENALLSLAIDGVGYQEQHVVSGAMLRLKSGATYLDFATSGEATLETTWTP